MAGYRGDKNRRLGGFAGAGLYVRGMGFTGRLKGQGCVAAWLAAVVAVAGVGNNAPGVIVYHEATGGDLSNNQLQPTPILLPAGQGSIVATMNTDTDQQDWFAVTIPEGFALTAIVLGDYDSSDPVAFLGFRQGSEFRGVYTEASSYNGYVHMGAESRFTDLLPLMANQVTSPGTLGFTIPLAAGTYTFLAQQTGADTLYQLDFEVTAVPGAWGAGALVGGLAMVARRRR